jgi:maleylpyruvate isomerase
LRHHFHCEAGAIDAWCATWISAGVDALEALLAADFERGSFCFGGSPTLADVYLIPQVESARRFKVDLSRRPSIRAVDAACSQLEAFHLVAPTQQPDAVA